MDRFTVGKIVNTHGLRGELKVQYYTEALEDFEDFEYLIIQGEGEKKFKVDSIRSVKNQVLVKFAEFNDINEVEFLKNREVYYLREDYEDLEEGVHYIVDLIGIEVYDKEKGLIGTVREVLQNTAQDIYVVKRADGKGDVLIPGVPLFIQDIKLEEKRMNVTLIEGLME